MPSRRPALKGSREFHSGPKSNVVVGLAHVAVGALYLPNLLFVMLTATESGEILVPSTSAFVLLPIASILGGLWLADGRRRGAVVALVSDAVRVLVLLFVPANSGSTLNLLLFAALGAAVIWVLPRLNVESDAESRREQARVADKSAPR
jgi:hypothetical protein